MWTSTLSTSIGCPYCGEVFEHIVDPSVAEQSYVEDCYVCCRPIHLYVQVGETGDLEVVARDENEC